MDNLDNRYNDSRSYPSASEGKSTSKEEKGFAVQEAVDLAGKEREMTLCISKSNSEGAMLRRELQTTFYVITGKEEGNLGHLSSKWCQFFSLGWQDPLEKGKATHSSILAWGIAWTV